MNRWERLRRALIWHDDAICQTPTCKETATLAIEHPSRDTRLFCAQHRPVSRADRRAHGLINRPNMGPLDRVYRRAFTGILTRREAFRLLET